MKSKIFLSLVVLPVVIFLLGIQGTIVHHGLSSIFNFFPSDSVNAENYWFDAIVSFNQTVTTGCGNFVQISYDDTREFEMMGCRSCQTIHLNNFINDQFLKYEPGINHLCESNTCSSQTETTALDIYLVLDLTGTFSDDLHSFQSQAALIFANILQQYPDTRFGLGTFEDYPIPPFGDLNDGDQAYRQVVDLTFEELSVIDAITHLETKNGGDVPESQLPAIFQSATGLGQDLSGLGYPEASIEPNQQANFRPEAAKLILLWTDAPFHIPGDPGDIPYPGPGYAETATAVLNSWSSPPARVIGISSGVDGVTDLEEIAELTGALAPDTGVDCNADSIIDINHGEPLVCVIGSKGEGIWEAFVALIEAFMLSIPPKEYDIFLPLIIN